MWQQSVTPSIRGRLEERNDICVMQFSTKTAQGSHHFLHDRSRWAAVMGKPAQTLAHV